MTKYAIREIFHSIQAEGTHVGRAAVFIRFAGCNMWNGLEKDRQRDAERHHVSCPLWCDTDFRTEQSRQVTISELISWISSLRPTPVTDFLVLTGGEPLLQLDAELLEALQQRGWYVAIETNGSVPLNCPRPDWVCVSPKNDKFVVVPDELKVVYPASDPEAMLHRLREIDRFRSIHHGVIELILQPEDGSQLKANTEACVRYVQDHPEWRLSVQIQKLIGVR